MVISTLFFTSLEETKELLDKSFKDNDVVITTGGVSMGEKVSLMVLNKHE